NPEEQLPSCESITGRFLFFYLGNEGVDPAKSKVNCPQTLLETIDDYWVKLNSNPQTKNFYRIEYAINFDDTTSELKNALYSAYRPGPLQGANNGKLTNPYTGLQENMIRNFYSTKLISLRSVTGHNDDSFDEKGTNFPIISEGNNVTGGSGDLSQQSFQNTLNFNITNWDISDVNQ